MIYKLTRRMYNSILEVSPVYREEMRMGDTERVIHYINTTFGLKGLIAGLSIEED